jgi:hypothetical protein
VSVMSLAALVAVPVAPCTPREARGVGPVLPASQPAAVPPGTGQGDQGGKSAPPSPAPVLPASVTSAATAASVDP